jgi:hypothetical protein
MMPTFLPGHRGLVPVGPRASTLWVSPPGSKPSRLIVMVAHPRVVSPKEDSRACVWGPRYRAKLESSKVGRGLYRCRPPGDGLAQKPWVAPQAPRRDCRIACERVRRVTRLCGRALGSCGRAWTSTLLSVGVTVEVNDGRAWLREFSFAWGLPPRGTSRQASPQVGLGWGGKHWSAGDIPQGHPAEGCKGEGPLRKGGATRRRPSYVEAWSAGLHKFAALPPKVQRTPYVAQGPQSLLARTQDGQPSGTLGRMPAA